jgi:hypothetical protein
LSSFDNLVHSAMGTEQQRVFDEMNKMVKHLAQVELEGLTQGATSPASAPECPVRFLVNGKVDRAILVAACDQQTGLAMFMASATTKDIEKMKTPGSSAAPAWRTILGLSLQAFARSATAYSQALASQARSQPIYRMQTSCYTNFLGRTAITHCY